MHPSRKSMAALFLLMALLTYNVMALGPAGATDASPEEAEVAAAEEAVAAEAAPAEEAAPVEEAAPAEEVTAEEPAPAEEAPAASDASEADEVEAAATDTKVSARTSGSWKTWTKTRIVRPLVKMARAAGPGSIFIAEPGTTTATGNQPQQGECTFDIIWDGFTQNKGDSVGYTVTPQGASSPVIASGNVTLDNSGDGTTDPNHIEFTPTTLAGVPLHNDGSYHVEANSIDNKQKTFKVHQSCGPAPGTIRIDKAVATGDDATQVFDFTGTINSNAVQDMSANTAVQVFSNVPAGTYSVGEANIPTDWDLTDITCKTTDGTTNDTDSTNSSTPGLLTPADTAQITLSADETVTCTFTNDYTAPAGTSTLTVKKMVTSSGTLGGYVPADEEFSFSGTGITGTPSLKHGQSGGAKTHTLPADDLTINEAIGSEALGWSLQSVSCVDTANGDATVTPDSVNLVTGAVTLDLASSGMTVVCTFNNHFQGGSPGTPGGVIRVDKVTDPAGSTQSFDFTLTPQGGTAVPFSLTDAAAPFSSSQPVGTYAVAETVPAGWDLSSATCSDGSNPAAVNLGSGEVVTCTFTNTERGSITAVLDLVPLPSGNAERTILARFAASNFVFTGDLAGTLVDDGGSIGPNEVVPGTYSTTEIVPDGWDLTSIDCTDPSGNSSGSVATATATFAVGPGEDVVCTFTNVEEEVKGGVTGPGNPGTKTPEIDEPEVLARPATALPLTGSNPVGLVAISALLILSGAAALFYTKKNPALPYTKKNRSS